MLFSKYVAPRMPTSLWWRIPKPPLERPKVKTEGVRDENDFQVDLLIRILMQKVDFSHQDPATKVDNSHPCLSFCVHRLLLDQSVVLEDAVR